MKSVNPIIEKKVKEIVGDSTGREAALKIHEWLQKNSTYGYYNDRNKTLEQILKEERMSRLNCSGRMHKMRK